MVSEREVVRPFTAMQLRACCGFLGLLLICNSCARPRESEARTSSLRSAYESLAYALGDERLTEDERCIASKMLHHALDKAVLPILIRYVDDRRVFSHDAEFAGETMESTRVQTVGMESEQILRFLVAGGESVEYDVIDWNRWWAENCDRSLDEIIRIVREDSRPYRPQKGG